jgi:hypothetical protein
MQDQPNPNGKVHAELGPSSSDIWLTCLQAPREWKKYPPRVSGWAAHEGTLCHTLCEAALLQRGIPWKPGLTFQVEGDSIAITQEMLNAVQLYVNTTNLISDIARWRAVEKRVYFSWLWDTPPAEDLFGTADFAAADDKALYVVDLKYGKGKAVHVEGNTQLLCYGVGAYGMLREQRPDLAETIEEVSLTVVQPRAGGAPVRQWNIPVGDLIYWAYSVLKPSIDKILSTKTLELVPGRHCYFCAASRGCPAYQKHRLSESMSLFTELTAAEMLAASVNALDTPI